MSAEPGVPSPAFPETGGFDAAVLLADFAQVGADGRVSAIGIGIDWIGLGSQHSVFVMVAFPWAQTNQKVIFRIELHTADGSPVMTAGPTGEEVPVAAEQHLELGRPAGVPHGVAMSVPWAVTIAPGLPLVPAQRYEWVLTINDMTAAHWRRAFQFAPNLGQQHAG